MLCMISWALITRLAPKHFLNIAIYFQKSIYVVIVLQHILDFGFSSQMQRDCHRGTWPLRKENPVTRSYLPRIHQSAAITGPSYISPQVQLFQEAFEGHDTMRKI